MSTIWTKVSFKLQFGGILLFSIAGGLSWAQSPALGTQRAPATAAGSSGNSSASLRMNPSRAQPFQFDYSKLQKDIRGALHGDDKLNSGGSSPFLRAPLVTADDDDITNRARQFANEMVRGKEEAEKREAEATKTWMREVLAQFRELREGINLGDASILRDRAQKMGNLERLAKEIEEKRSKDPYRIETPGDKLYIDEYPLPPNARWEKLGSMEKARMPWLNPNGLFLLEGNEEKEYDSDGFLIEPSKPADPKVITRPRYEKLSPAQRARLWWLPDSEEQMYLVE